jgi:hypothetical protein
VGLTPDLFAQAQPPVERDAVAPAVADDIPPAPDSPEVLALIVAGQIPPGSVRASVCPDGDRCSRCRVPHRWLTPAYWDPAKRFCTSCCGIVTAELDGEHASWPPEPLERASADVETFHPAGERTGPHSAPPLVASPAEPVVAGGGST